MASVRAPTIRRFLLSPPNLRPTQRRWAQVHDVRFLVTHGEAQQRVLSKYREKLDRKAKEEGLSNIDELKTVYKDKIESLRKEATVPGATGPLHAASEPAQRTSPFPAAPPPPSAQPTQSSSTTTTASTTPSPPKPTDPTVPPGLKTLTSYLDLPKTLTLPPTEIEYLWRLRHARNPQSLCAVLPHPSWTQLHRTARQHPQFILPLPREGQGAEIHFLQWAFPHADVATVLFTHLAEYKLRGEFASPHTTVSFHLELAEPKGLVLGAGEVVKGRGVSVDEAKWLLMCLQKFYGAQAEERAQRKRLLERFSSGDGGFRVEELLEEAEMIV